MAVHRAVAASVVDHDDVAVAALPAAKRYLAIARSVDWRTGRRGIIDTVMRTHRTENRMHAANAEQRRDTRELHRRAQEGFAQRPSISTVKSGLAMAVSIV